MIVYAGAIVVLFLFVIMLLNLQTEVRALGGFALVTSAVVPGLGLVVLLVSTLRRTLRGGMTAVPAGFGETRGLSERLFTAYLLPFELTSVLLLAAMVGVLLLARRRTG